MKLKLTVLIICLCSLAHAELKYEQTFALGNYISHEEAKKSVGAFAIAAKGDPNILIRKVEYRQRGSGDCIFYEGVLTCYVSEIDKDLMRISMKACEIRNQAKQVTILQELEEHMEK